MEKNSKVQAGPFIQSTWSWPTGTSGCSSATALSENYTYDSLCTGLSGPSVGLRTSMTDASGTTCWAYDNMKRAVTVQRTVNTGQTNPVTGQAPALAISYLYNYDGSVNQITYPSGRQLNYTLASNGSQTAGRDGMLWRVDATTGAPSSYISGAQYAPDGQIAQAALGQCGGGEYASYDQRLRPRHLLYSTAAASSAASEVQTGGCPNPAVTTDLMHKHYNYLTGDIESIANCVNLARSQMYTYDSLDRLSTAYTNLANASYPGWGEQYVIDAWGNLTNIDAYSSTLSGENFQFAPASAQNQLNFGTPSYYFDSVGNQKRSADGSHTFAYDADNRIASVDGASVNYTYDGDGDRMFKAQGTNGTVYWRGPDGQTLAESDLTGAIISEYIFFDGKRLARVDYTATPPAMEFYFEDHLGSTSMTLASNLAGSPPEDTDYYPFGGIAAEFGTGDTNHYKFTGKERDAESGNDYFEARYYSSSMGRFMSPDWAAKEEPVPYAQLDDPQTLNLYSYVENNPLARADADGHCDWCKSVAQWVSVHVASVGIGIQNVRNSYNAAVGAATTPAARDAAKAAARTQGPALGRAAANQAAADPARVAARAAKSDAALAATVGKTNAGVNATADIAGTVGKGAAVLAVGVAVYDVATAPEGQRGATAAAEGGGLAGAWAGGEAGAAGGALVGSIFPGPGTVIGAVVGGVGGSIVGGMTGHAAGAEIYKAATTP